MIHELQNIVNSPEHTKLVGFNDEPQTDLVFRANPLPGHSNSPVVEGILKQNAEDHERKGEMIDRANHIFSSTHDDQAEIDQAQMNQLIENANKLLTPMGLKFEYIAALHHFQVQVVNLETKEVIREFPSRKLIEMQVNLKEALGKMLSGDLLFDRVN